MSNHVSIVEVGPRDGLQNVKDLLSSDQKKNFIQYLLDRGFTDIEAGSFVRPDRVPAMADTPQIASHFQSANDRLWYLVPNLKGLESALKAGVTQLAFFTASSESFNTKNIGMTISQSEEVIRSCMTEIQAQGYSLAPQWNQKPKAPKQLKVRLYISTVIGCPYEGKIKPEATLRLLHALAPLGFSQVSLGDTIGVGVPRDWNSLLRQIDKTLIQKNNIALHCHDTYATALSCVAEGLSQGVRTFDSSIGGLGGCPYAPGATGNLATEDLLYFLENEGMKTDVKLKDILDCYGNDRTGPLVNRSKVWKALSSKDVSC